MIVAGLMVKIQIIRVLKYKVMKFTVIWSVENSKRCSKLIDKNFKKPKYYKDSFDIALMHFDGESSYFDKLSWISIPHIVIRSFEIGSKTLQWKLIKPDIVKNYDFIWLPDSDLSFERLNWNLIRKVIMKTKPFYCQPSVVARYQAGRSSDIHCLRHKPGRVVTFADRSEVQTPILNTRLWPLIH